jgi:hypothetical protein
MTYESFNGNNLYNIANVPTGYQYYGPSGEILILQTDNLSDDWLSRLYLPSTITEILSGKTPRSVLRKF